MKNKSNSARLWTRDFTIITVGSAVSMFGNAMSGFALSLLVLDYTASPFYYAVFLAVYTFPQVIIPIFSGALLDRFSRKKTIYSLDFISSALYLSAALLLRGGWFSFPVLAAYSFVVGSINSIYTVAYQSFYPLLITEGNYRKAYSVSSIIETASAIMVPISTFIYKQFGIAPLLFGNAVSFFLAAVTETMIKGKENYIEVRKLSADKKTTGKQLISDIKDGFKYLTAEKGLLAISLYFAFNSLSSGASTAITLPYFKATFNNGEYIFMVVWGTALVGRAIGSALHYRIKLPVSAKYGIALVSFIVASLIEGIYLFFPVAVMIILCFFNGYFGITGNTIRLAATQHYVPDELKGRFNGALNMLNTIGSLSGELLAGAAAAFFPTRIVLLIFMSANALSALVLIGGNKRRVKKIYNTDQ